MNKKILIVVLMLSMFHQVVSSEAASGQSGKYPYGHGPINECARRNALFAKQALQDGSSVGPTARAVYVGAPGISIDHIRQFKSLALLQEAIKKHGASWNDVTRYAQNELDDFVDRELALPTIGNRADQEEDELPSSDIIATGAARIIAAMRARLE